MRSKRGSKIGHEILSEHTHTEELWSRLKVKGMERKCVSGPVMVTVSRTGQEFQKSRQREQFEYSGLETKSQCSEKRYLPKGALNLELKRPESEAEWDYHRRGQKTIKDTSLAVYSRKFSFRVINSGITHCISWLADFFFFCFYSGPSFIATSPKPPDGRMFRGLKY